MSDLIPTLWILEHHADDSTLERLGDGRLLGDQTGGAVGVISSEPEGDDARLIAHGADRVVRPAMGAIGLESRLALVGAAMGAQSAQMIFAPGDPAGREWAAGLCARHRWKLISPALMVQFRSGKIEATMLDRSERLSRKVVMEPGETFVATLKPGVGEARAFDASRVGQSIRVTLGPCADAVTARRVIPADPRRVDIRFADRLVAGGRGVGGKEGFAALTRFADKLGAGVAASRMAVDMGWIEYERQVGQTGKTVRPHLYVACGISGASHHLEGMSESGHVIAINSDPGAPIFKKAHLGLVADLFETLRLAEERMADDDA